MKRMVSTCVVCDAPVTTRRKTTSISPSEDLTGFGAAPRYCLRRLSTEATLQFLGWLNTTHKAEGSELSCDRCSPVLEKVGCDKKKRTPPSTTQLHQTRLHQTPDGEDMCPGGASGMAPPSPMRSVSEGGALCAVLLTLQRVMSPSSPSSGP